MPSSYFDDKPLNDEAVAAKMVRFHEAGNVEVMVDSVLRDKDSSREDTHAALALASDFPSFSLVAYLSGENPFLIEEVLRLNYASWQRELVENQWEQLSDRQKEYLTRIKDASVRRLALHTEALCYFHDKPFDVEVVQNQRVEWEVLHKHEFSGILSSALHDPDEDSREKIQAAIQEASARDIDIAFYNRFASTRVHDELIRTESSRLRTNVVDFLWPHLSTVQQNYLIELGNPDVRMHIADRWVSELDNDQLVRLLTDAEYPVRIAAYVNGISDEAKRLLSVSGAIDLDNGNFSVLAEASDADLDVIRGEASARHSSRAINHPAGSERLPDGIDEHSAAPPMRSELELAIESLAAPARGSI